MILRDKPAFNIHQMLLLEPGWMDECRAGDWYSESRTALNIQLGLHRIEG